MEREHINSWRDQLDDDDDDLDDEEDDDLDQDGYGNIGDGLPNSNNAFRNAYGRQLRSEESKRDHHNRLERKRRASIKTCYSSLREVIPTLRGTKASRAVILQKAVDHIDELRGIVHDVSNNIRELRRRDQSIKADLRRREVILQKKVSEYRDSKQKLQHQMQQQQIMRQQQKQQQVKQEKSGMEEEVQSPTSDDSQASGSHNTQVKQKQSVALQHKRKVTVATHNSSAISSKRQQQPQRTQVQMVQIPPHNSDDEQSSSPNSREAPRSSNYSNSESQIVNGQE